MYQEHFSPETGLLPDFVQRDEANRPRPAGEKFLESPYDGRYFLNAGRVPLRIGNQ